MTLGELKKDLRKHGIRVVFSTIVPPTDGMEAAKVTTYFSADEQATSSNKPQPNIYPLITNTTLDNEEVSREKILALKRSLIPDWDEE